MIRRHRASLFVAFALAGLIHPAAASEVPERWRSDPVASGLAGRWTGTGVVYGAEVKLDREWSFDLAGHFLRGEMAVEMPNGASFGARVYWSRKGANGYEMTWLDKTGQRRLYEAVGNAERREVIAHYLESSGEEAGWRRITYRIVDVDSYLELMSVETAEGWRQIAEFRFRRLAE